MTKNFFLRDSAADMQIYWCSVLHPELMDGIIVMALCVPPGRQQAAISHNNSF